MHRNKSPIRRYCSAPLAFIRFSPSSRFFHNSTLEHILCSKREMDGDYYQLLFALSFSSAQTHSSYSPLLFCLDGRALPGRSESEKRRAEQSFSTPTNENKFTVNLSSRRVVQQLFCMHKQSEKSRVVKP